MPIYFVHLRSLQNVNFSIFSSIVLVSTSCSKTQVTSKLIVCSGPERLDVSAALQQLPGVGHEPILPELVATLLLTLQILIMLKSTFDPLNTLHY